MKSPRERYYVDDDFKNLVDTIYQMIDRCQYTPTELREAVILAAIRHAERQPIPIPIELEMAIADWVEGRKT
uniref:Uncharacterized protein n=1 Tax=viral metagenome TaxID=1070528 RepID=A0A6M3LJZ8_9ZZZZ